MLPTFFAEILWQPLLACVTPTGMTKNDNQPPPPQKKRLISSVGVSDIYHKKDLYHDPRDVIKTLRMAISELFVILTGLTKE